MHACPRKINHRRLFLVQFGIWNSKITSSPTYQQPQHLPCWLLRPCCCIVAASFPHLLTDFILWLQDERWNLGGSRPGNEASIVELIGQTQVFFLILYFKCTHMLVLKTSLAPARLLVGIDMIACGSPSEHIWTSHRHITYYNNNQAISQQEDESAKVFITSPPRLVSVKFAIICLSKCIITLSVVQLLSIHIYMYMSVVGSIMLWSTSTGHYY